jgi:hypothetical protein
MRNKGAVISRSESVVQGMVENMSTYRLTKGTLEHHTILSTLNLGGGTWDWANPVLHLDCAGNWAIHQVRACLSSR